MRNLMRIAAASVALAAAAPALPCGLMQYTTTDTPAPVVAQAPKAEVKAEVKARPQKAKVARKTRAAEKQAPTVAKN